MSLSALLTINSVPLWSSSYLAGDFDRVLKYILKIKEFIICKKMASHTVTLNNGLKFPIVGLGKLMKFWTS